MARQTKSGIEYFSHDVDILQDRKVKLVKAKHGLIGYAIYMRLLEEIYREKGYYLDANDDFNSLFSDDNNLNYNVYIEVLNACIERELFNNELYNDYKILTSKRIQKNYFDATLRRKEVTLQGEFLLENPYTSYNLEKTNVNILGQNAYIETLNAYIGTQSKGKKSKGKNINVYTNKFHNFSGNGQGQYDDDELKAILSRKVNRKQEETT